jgi:hypothetical protein
MVALQQKERVNVSLQQATKAKTAFLANMSHGTPFRRHPTPYPAPPTACRYLFDPCSASRFWVAPLAELRTPMHGIIGRSLARIVAC